MIDRNPEYNEQNVAYLIYNSLHDHRVLVIYNCRRMIDFIDKRQLNPNASGEQGLLHKPEALAFHVDPPSRTPWLISLQDSTWLHHSPLYQTENIEISLSPKAEWERGSSTIH